MADELDMVRRIRRTGRDRPDRTKIDFAGGIDNSIRAINIPAGHLNKFPQSGVLLEPDDGRGELMYTTGRDDDANTLLVDRGADGTAATAHDNQTVLLIKPRWLALDIMEAVNTIIDLELWPHVWVPGETTIDYQSANSYFGFEVADVDEVSYVYQLLGGEQYKIGHRHIAASLSDDANFPNGFLLLPGAIDASTIYVAYRSRPTLANLTPELEQLVVLGAMAQLQLTEESASTAPDTSVVDRSLQPGSHLRAGALGLQRFQGARSALMISLQQAETDRRRQLVRNVS